MQAAQGGRRRRRRFDLNYREKLWNIWGGQQRAVEVVARIVEHVDVLVGNEEDLQKGLGIPGPEVAATSKLDPSAFFGMIDTVVKKHPQRQGRGDDAARGAFDEPPQLGRGGVDRRQDLYVAPTCELDVHGPRRRRRRLRVRLLLRPADRRRPEEAVKLGWAHGALLTTFPGDTTMATVEQVRAFARGGSARIQR